MRWERGARQEDRSGGGGGGGSDGGGRWEVGERARGEEIGVTRMQVRVPRIHIGDNLAQIKAMRLANVQTFGSNVWRPNINLSARR